MQLIDPHFLHLIVLRAENPNSHKYDLENCSPIVGAFFDIDLYYLTKIHNFKTILY